MEQALLISQMAVRENRLRVQDIARMIIQFTCYDTCQRSYIDSRVAKLRPITDELKSLTFDIVYHTETGYEYEHTEGYAYGPTEEGFAYEYGTTVLYCETSYPGLQLQYTMCPTCGNFQNSERRRPSPPHIKCKCEYWLELVSFFGSQYFQ